jgi:hypothetical protein
MLLDKSKLKESAYIGEELFRNEEDEKEHQCMIVRKTVEDGVFKLEEALKAYEINLVDYQEYLLKNFKQ